MPQELWFLELFVQELLAALGVTLIVADERGLQNAAAGHLVAEVRSLHQGVIIEHFKLVLVVRVIPRLRGPKNHLQEQDRIA